MYNIAKYLTWHRDKSDNFLPSQNLDQGQINQFSGAESPVETVSSGKAYLIFPPCRQYYSGDRKWKDDKIDKTISPGHSSEESEASNPLVSTTTRNKRSMTHRRTRSDSSASSLEEAKKEAEMRVRSPAQFYVDRRDGSYVAAFETGSPVQRKRGRLV